MKAIKILIGLGLVAVIGFLGFWGYKYYVCQGPTAQLDGDYTEYLSRCAADA